MTRTDAAIAGAIVLGIGLLGVDTSLAFEQAWRPASMAPAVTDKPGTQTFAAHAALQTGCAATACGRARPWPHGLAHTAAQPTADPCS
jgi:hypothetical protein